MNIRSKYTMSLTIVLLTFLFMGTISFGAELHSLDIEVDILDGGDGIITMRWDYTDDSGTEHYIPIKKEGISITDFYVEKNGVSYATIDSWDTNASKDEKNGKNGIVEKEDEVELCWGIGEYGRNQYTMSYRVEGLIRSLTDSNMLFYKLINDNLSEPPKEVNIDIYYKPKEFNTENVKMWGFGFDGDINLENGHVVWKSKKALAKKNYGIVLLQIDKDFLESKYEEEKDFESYKKEALKGSSYKNDSYNTFSLVIRFLKVGLNLFVVIIIVGGIVKTKLGNRNKFKIESKSYKGQYYRDIPYEEKSRGFILHSIQFKIGKT